VIDYETHDMMGAYLICMHMLRCSVESVPSLRSRGSDRIHTGTVAEQNRANMKIGDSYLGV
jgi:hypothetical protein